MRKYCPAPSSSISKTLARHRQTAFSSTAIVPLVDAIKVLIIGLL
jgi:hypothetical protein